MATNGFTPSGVDPDEVLSCGSELTGVNRWVVKGADVEIVGLLVLDDAFSDLVGVSATDPGEDDIYRESGLHWAFNIQSILNEDDHRVSGRDGWAHDLRQLGCAIGDVLGATHNVVEARGRVGACIRYGIQNYRRILDLIGFHRHDI